MPKTEKRKARDAHYQQACEITDAINEWRKRIVWDGDLGAVIAHPWGVRKSAGADVLQIITEQRPSKLEQRSQSSD